MILPDYDETMHDYELLGCPIGIKCSLSWKFYYDFIGFMDDGYVFLSEQRKGSSYFQSLR